MVTYIVCVAIYGFNLIAMMSWEEANLGGACLLAARMIQSPQADPGGSKTGLGSEGDKGMAKEVLFLVEDAVEGGYIARALGHSIFTEADSWEELKEAIRDAVHCHFDPEEQPDLIRLHAVREEVVAA
jgi:hypothetical protein